MTGKSIMDAYPGRQFYNTIANFGKMDFNLPKKQTYCVVASASQEIYYINDELFS